MTGEPVAGTLICGLAPSSSVPPEELPLAPADESRTVVFVDTAGAVPVTNGF